MRCKSKWCFTAGLVILIKPAEIHLWGCFFPQLHKDDFSCVQKMFFSFSIVYFLFDFSLKHQFLEDINSEVCNQQVFHFFFPLLQIVISWAISEIISSNNQNSSVFKLVFPAISGLFSSGVFREAAKSGVYPAWSSWGGCKQCVVVHTEASKEKWIESTHTERGHVKYLKHEETTV